VVLACGERRKDIDETIQRVRKTSTTAQILRVRTKADRHAGQEFNKAELVVSTFQRIGLRELIDRIRDAVQQHLGSVGPLLPVITRARQQLALEHARDEIVAFTEVWEGGVLPGIVAAVHVRSAVHALHELIGRIDTDTILGAVFERFCIGK
jgi:tRNA modification GTPase